MNFRLVLAALAGGLAMFMWTSFAHVMTPLGYIGMSSLTNDAAVRTALAQSQGPKSGLYIFPAYDPKARDGAAEMARATQAARTGPSGLVLYHPAGKGAEMGLETMGSELLLEVIEAFMLAIVIANSTALTLTSRLILSMAVGFAAALTTNGSQQVWYGFPTDYTRAQVVIDVVRYLVAGLVVSLVLRPKKA
jgi:hypothetical protein